MHTLPVWECTRAVDVDVPVAWEHMTGVRNRASEGAGMMTRAASDLA
jgi:hypothetical protein